MYRIKKKIWHIVFGIIALLAVGGVIQKPTEGDASLTQGIQRFMAWGKSISAGSGSYGNQQPLPPTKQQAEVVLTPAVRQQLGNNIVWNGHGAFIINNNQAGLNTNISSAPYAVNQLDSQGRAWRGDAWLNKTTRHLFYRSEDSYCFICNC